MAKTEAMRKLCGAPSLELHEAVLNADYARVSALLADGIPISEQDPDGETALHLAVKASLGVLTEANISSFMAYSLASQGPDRSVTSPARAHLRTEDAAHPLQGLMSPVNTKR